jgi:hypothetical protein
MCFKVNYYDEYPFLDICGNSDEENLKIFLSKSSIWSYENEYRVISTENHDQFGLIPRSTNGFVNLPNGALESVIVGCQISDDDLNFVRSLINGKGIALKKAVKVPNCYELEIINEKMVNSSL